LTVFFIMLTLSTGLISINCSLSPANAQNNVLSQKGNNNEAEQDTEQSRVSEQDNQVVSGDSNVLSGNNVLCQDQNNSDLTQLSEVCDSEALENLNGNTLFVFSATTGSPGLVPSTNLNIIFDGRIVFNQTIIDASAKRITIDGQASSFLIAKGTTNNFEIKDMKSSAGATCQHTLKTFECGWNGVYLHSPILVLTLWG